MRTKSTESLSAAEHLLLAKFADAAANRLYYALYQAGVHALDVAGVKRTDISAANKDYWKHRSLVNSIYLARKNHNDKYLFEDALTLREQADYQLVPVEPSAVKDLMRDAREFVEKVCA